MQRLGKLTGILVASMLLVAGVAAVAPVSASTDEAGTAHYDYRHGHHDRTWASFQAKYDLTDDQLTEVRELVRTMNADGATRAEIREAVIDQLADWDIDVFSVEYYPRAQALQTEFDLTDAQLRDLIVEVSDRKTSGATKAQIHQAVVECLESYGVEREELRQFVREQRVRHFQDDFNLTDDQLAEIVEEAREMRENGADREQIRRMVFEKLEAFGVDMSEALARFYRAAHHGHHH